MRAVFFLSLGVRVGDMPRVGGECGEGGQARWPCGTLDGSSAHAHMPFVVWHVCQVELERLEKEAAQRAARLAEESLSVEKRLVEAMRWVKMHPPLQQERH